MNISPLDNQAYNQKIVEEEDVSSFLAFLYKSDLEKILSDPKEKEKKLKFLKNLDFSEVSFHHFQTFMINHFDLILRDDSPHSSHFFVEVAKTIFEKRAFPWSLIQGKSFLAHLQDLQSYLPSVLDFSSFLQEFGENSVLLFEKMIVKKVKTDSMLDSEEKIKQYNLLLEEVKELQEKKFPGVDDFIKEIQECVEKQRKDLEFLSNFVQKLKKDKNLSYEKTLKEVQEECKSYYTQTTLLTYLINQDDFSLVSLFLDAVKRNFWHRDGFQEICLEKALDVEKGYSGLKPDSALGIMAIAWNQYLMSEETIFKNVKIFKEEEGKEINKLLQEIIQTLVIGMQTAIEDNLETHDEIYGKASLSLPLSFYRLEKRQKIFLTLLLPNHAIGCLIKPEDSEESRVSFYNTGWGIIPHHPVSPNQLKYQTALHKKIPTSDLLKENIWKELRKLKNKGDPDQFYSIWNQPQLESDSLDFETPQATGTCIFQFTQAFVRDAFLQKKELGDKKVRFSTYKIVMADFMLFLGKKRFPIEERKENSSEKKLLSAWLEKEEKLLAILELAESTDLHLFYEEFKIAKEGVPTEKPSIILQRVFSNYTKNLHDRTVEALKAMPDNEFPVMAANRYKYSKFKKELASLVKERTKDNPSLFQLFKKKLDFYKVKFEENSPS